MMENEWRWENTKTKRKESPKYTNTLARAHTHTRIMKRNIGDVMNRMEFVKVEFYSIRIDK